MFMDDETYTATVRQCHKFLRVVGELSPDEIADVGRIDIDLRILTKAKAFVFSVFVKTQTEDFAETEVFLSGLSLLSERIADAIDWIGKDEREGPAKE